MRSWETKDITDILIEHHEELREQASLLEWTDGEKLDDKCIVIESFLEETFGMEWQGDHFVDSHGNTL